jgi:hypothetical protein
MPLTPKVILISGRLLEISFRDFYKKQKLFCVQHENHLKKKNQLYLK